MIRVHRLSAASLLLVIAMGFVGCGGADQTSGPPKPDENAAQRQKEMNDYYKTNPLPKPKR